MKTFTVIGIYTDNMQRYAMSVEARNARSAQKKVARDRKEQGLAILVAGVAEGRVEMVDQEDHAKWPMLSDLEHAG